MEPGVRTKESELISLRRGAEELARQRGHKPTTAHLLAMLAGGRDDASQLLLERRLDEDVLLRAARITQDDAADAMAKTLTRARELAGRGPGRGEPSRIHLLFALLQEPGTAAHRALVQCGIDVTRLRATTMSLAMGLAPPRRMTTLTPQARQQDQQRQPMMKRSTESAVMPVMPKKPVGLEKPKPAKLADAHPRERIQPGETASSPAPGPSKSSPTPKKKAKKDDGRFALDPKHFPLLSQLGQNLTELAAKGELDPVVGRDAEIERALDVLAKRHGNNPALVGVSGVGKTSVVRGLAARIAEGSDVACFEDKIVIAVDPAAMLAGTGVRGSLAERIQQLKAELAKAKGRVLVFFDEMHVLFGQDDEASSELRLALSRGELVCLGATTEIEYRKVINADPALSRCFTPIDVCELSPEEALLAIEGVAPLFAKHHACTYDENALAKAVTWSVRYLTDKALPDKAVQILDLAGARARRRSEKVVGVEHVAEVVSELAGVPEDRLLETDADRLLRLEELLGDRIVGHRDALARIATVLRRNASGFRSKRPIGTFLLLGPTGVGKTETAKAIAECLFHSESAMTRLDLSEYAESHAIARLVGSPPGYVGHDAGGQLTESVRRRPYQVVLLDEIEKAHRDVLEGFLQVFDEGRLTDGRGRTVDFTNTVILLTSNIGADLSPTAQNRGRIGFGGATKTDLRAREIAAYQDAVTDAARRALPPELFNRLDEVLAFAPLSRVDVGEVARRILRSLASELEAARGVTLEASDDAVDALLDAGGFDPELGARPMRRAIGRHIEAPIADMILKGQLRRGDVALIEVENGRLVVDAVTPAPRS